MGKKTKKITISEVILLIFAVLFISPIYLILINSFKSYQEVLVNPYFFPEKIILNNFLTIFNSTKFAVALRNSLINTISVVIALVLLSAMTSYALTRRKSGINNFLYLFFILGVLIPFQTYMIPLVKLFKVLAILRTPLALILTFVAQYTPLTVFIYCGFIKTVPREIEEAATIDGCGPYKRFFLIVFPLLKPCTASVVIFMSVAVWNAFIQPVTIAGTVAWKTLFVELFVFIQDRYFQQWNLTFASCLIAALPMTILYLIMQSKIIKGLTSGSLKF